MRAAGRKRWNHDLGLITVSGGTEGEKRVFYTALYHALLHPNVFNDVDGEYIGFDRQIHVAKGFNVYANFSGWDIYRSEVQLLAMLFPKETSDMVTSLVLDAQQGGGGGLPIWPIANNEACTMVGSPASPIIAGAYAFGARTFDAHSALAAMLRGATDANARSGSCPESDNLDDYLKYGYLGPESLRPDKRSSGPSQTLESATADFSIAQLAQALGDSNTYRTFMKRAQFWRNTFDTETGYIAPRRKDGSFIRVGPADNKYYVEGNAEQYSWGVPYNMRALLDLMGGNAKVVARLDKFFTELNAFETKPYCWIGNEPSFAIPWAYDFALAPWTTQAVTRRIELEWFPPTPEGLPGNDDLGATSTWYVFAALGAYPAIPAVGGLALNSPVFPAAVIHLGNGKSIKIEAENASAPNPYVQSSAGEWQALRKDLAELRPLKPRRHAAFHTGQHRQQELGNQTGGRSAVFCGREVALTCSLEPALIPQSREKVRGSSIHIAKKQGWRRLLFRGVCHVPQEQVLDRPGKSADSQKRSLRQPKAECKGGHNGRPYDAFSC